MLTGRCWPNCTRSRRGMWDVCERGSSASILLKVTLKCGIKVLGVSPMGVCPPR